MKILKFSELLEECGSGDIAASCGKKKKVKKDKGLKTILKSAKWSDDKMSEGCNCGKKKKKIKIKKFDGLENIN